MHRESIADALDELATLGELAGENPFKVKAFSNAARTLRRASMDWNEALAPGGLESVPGIGKGIAGLIREGVRTGRIAALEELRAATPEGVRSLVQVRGLGPKKVRTLWKDLGILSPWELQYACTENRLVTLPGFGPRMQEKILLELRLMASREGKVLLPVAMDMQEQHTPLLKKFSPARPRWAGEAPRGCEVVGGLVLLAVREWAGGLVSHLELQDEGGRWCRRLPGGTPFALIPAASDSLGSASVWETSSEPFREALRRRLADTGLRWGPEGLFREGELLATEEEEDFWDRIGIPAIPPECRELPEALDSDLSNLIRAEDLRGTFHVHSDWSDGGASLDEMAAAAEKRGWEYLGICDHSSSAVYANGLSPDRLRAQGEDIAALQLRRSGLKIFRGVESDILADGELDYSPEDLRRLDLVVASVHSRFAMDEEAQTRRLVKAIENPAATFLGHPTGRLLLAREAYAHRWEEVVEGAARAGAAVELNANPHRLDVDWRRLPGLRAAGVPIAINPDAHSVEGLDDIWWGVLMARKGLARRGDVINAMDCSSVAEYLRHRKGGALAQVD